MFFFYKNHAGKPDFLPTDRLVAGLKTVLNHYPILYGRLALRDDGECEVRPSTEGVPFIEAATEEDFAALEPDCPQHRITSDFHVMDQLPSEHLPLLVAKVVRFANNSGVAICFTCSHYITDGYSRTLFIKNWAAIVRGELKLPFPPADGRQLLRLDPKPSEEEQRQLFQQQQEQHQPDYQPGSNESVNKGVIIRFTTDKLQALKADAIASLSDAEKEAGWFSTMDAVCMLVWRAAVRARVVAKDRPLTYLAAVTMRDKLANLPMEYFGNVINRAMFTATAGDIVDGPLGRVAAMHRQEILASRAQTMEQWLMQVDITSKASLAERVLVRVPYVDYIATDWSKFKCYTIDFGEGCPTFLRHPIYVQKRIICILDRPCAPDGSSTGYDVSISVDETSYDRFCTDKELLAYGTILG